MELEVTALIPASPERVFALYTDHESWARWAGVKEVVLRQKGEPPPNGVGAIRVVRGGGLAVEEEVIAFEPAKRMVYRLVAGAPIRAHEGEVRFAPEGTGTRITWRVRGRPLIPGTGWLLRRVLTRAFDDILARLAREFA